MGGRSGGAAWESAGGRRIGSGTESCEGCHLGPREGATAMPLTSDAQ